MILVEWVTVKKVINTFADSYERAICILEGYDREMSRAFRLLAPNKGGAIGYLYSFCGQR